MMQKLIVGILSKKKVLAFQGETKTFLLEVESIVVYVTACPHLGKFGINTMLN